MVLPQKALLMSASDTASASRSRMRACRVQRLRPRNQGACCVSRAEGPDWGDHGHDVWSVSRSWETCLILCSDAGLDGNVLVGKLLHVVDLGWRHVANSFRVCHLPPPICPQIKEHTVCHARAWRRERSRIGQKERVRGSGAEQERRGGGEREGVAARIVEKGRWVGEEDEKKQPHLCHGQHHFTQRLDTRYR